MTLSQTVDLSCFFVFCFFHKPVGIPNGEGVFWCCGGKLVGILSAIRKRVDEIGGYHTELL